MSDPARLFLWSGLIWQGALRAYWVSLVVRITVDLGLPSLQLVLLGTAMEVAVLLSEVPTGVVADTISRK
ncbi:MAG: MFS transporter, partial [Acidimicrobiia bacterium]|nr:MFS transporter [Acidimicrobiia bacterium]